MYLAYLAQEMMAQGDTETRIAPGTKTKYGAIPLDMQSRVINSELSMIGLEVLKATEQHKKKKPYSPPQQLVTPAVKFLGGILDGTARLSMVVTLSSVDQNGW